MRIDLTDAAAEHIKKLMKEHSLVDHAVRVSLSDSYDYTLDIVDDAADRDRSFEINGVTVLCDPRTWLYIEKTRIDFEASKGAFTFAPSGART